MRLVGHVFGQVVLLVVRRFDRVEVLVEPRLVLRGLACEEAVEVVETVPGWPAVERPHRRRLIRRRVVPLAEGCRAVAVVVQHLSDRRRRFGNDSGVAVEVGSPFGNRTVADSMVVASSQERRSGRRADRRCVEAVVADSLIAEARQRRRVNLSAEGVCLGEANVVDQDDKDIGGTGAQSLRLLPPLHRRIEDRCTRLACRGSRREWQHRTVILRWRNRWQDKAEKGGDGIDRFHCIAFLAKSHTFILLAALQETPTSHPGLRGERDRAVRYRSIPGRYPGSCCRTGPHRSGS